MPDFPHPKPSVSMADLLKSRVVPVKKSRGMGERQELICKVAYELGIDKHYLSGLYFQTKDFTDEEIISAKNKALAWDGATLEAKSRWFRKLIKEKRVEIIQKLNGS